MCGDPGFLTCRDTLNDCSGFGDCFRGRCFCHAGRGGADCSLPVCFTGCPDVRATLPITPLAVSHAAVCSAEELTSRLSS